MPRGCSATVPYSALEAFEADNRSRMFYRVSSLGGEMVSGFAELPFWRGKLPDAGPLRSAGRFLRRQLSMTSRSASPCCCSPWPGIKGRGMAAVQVAETLELRHTLARQILIDTLWRQALLVP